MLDRTAAAARGEPLNVGQLPPCADRDDELPAAEVAAKGLDVRKRWLRCKVDHGQHCLCGKGK